MARTTGKVVEAAPPLPARERRYVYGGSAPAGWTADALRPNRRGARRKFSTFNIILLLFGIGGAIVFYVNNILSINRLASEVGQLEAEYQKIQGINQALRTDVSSKSSLEHISPAALDQLGLRASQTQQVWFTIDRDKLRELGVTPAGSQ
jgi:cell division protein FtsB